MSPDSGHRDGDAMAKFADGLARVAAPLLERLLWRWPTAAFTRLARALIANPTIALLSVALIVSLLTVRYAITRGLVGEPVRHAWKLEIIAQKNVDTVKAFLKKHADERPARTYEWQKPGLGRVEYERRVREREDWEEEETRAEAIKRENLRHVPSSLAPFGAAQSFEGDFAALWEVYYHADHFLVRSWYARLLLLYFAAGLVFAWRASPERKRLKWKGARRASSEEALLLGLDTAFHPYYLTEKERNHHILIAGTTGSGKTEALGLLARHDIFSGRGLVFFDMKGDRQQAHAMLEACARAGRQDDFLFFTTDESTPCHTYSGTASAWPSILVDRLMMAGVWSGEPFYSEMARAVLARVIPALAGRGQGITLDEIRTAVGSEPAYKLVSTWADPFDRGRFEADLSNWTKFFEQTSGLRHNLENFCQLGPRICAAAPEIDFREVFAKNRVVYIELNSQMRGVLAGSMARLMLEDLKQISGERAIGRGARSPFSLYIDEARHAVYEGFTGLITQCRSAGIGLVLATQSPLDFQSKREEGVMRAIIQNTNTKLLFRQIDHESAELCANLAGTVDTVSRTTQLVEGAILGPEKSGVYSEREVKEYIAHPDRLKRLETGRALLIKGTSECAIVEVDYRPLVPRRAFAVAPRAKAPTATKPNLAALVAAVKEHERGELAKRNAAPAGAKEKSGPRETVESDSDAHSGPVKRKRRATKNELNAKEQGDERSKERKHGGADQEPNVENLPHAQRVKRRVRTD